MEMKLVAAVEPIGLDPTYPPGTRCQTVLRPASPTPFRPTTPLKVTHYSSYCAVNDIIPFQWPGTRVRRIRRLATGETSMAKYLLAALSIGIPFSWVPAVAQEHGRFTFPEDSISAPNLEENNLTETFRRHTTVVTGAPMHHRISAFVQQFDFQGGLVRNLELSDDDFDALAVYTIREKIQSHQASAHVRTEVCNTYVLDRPAGSIDAVAVSTALRDGYARNHMEQEQRFTNLLQQLSAGGRAQVSNALAFFDNSTFHDRNYPAIVAEHPGHYATHFQNLCSQPIDPISTPTFVGGFVGGDE